MEELAARSIRDERSTIKRRREHTMDDGETVIEVLLLGEPALAQRSDALVSARIHVSPLKARAACVKVAVRGWVR